LLLEMEGAAGKGDVVIGGEQGWVVARRRWGVGTRGLSTDTQKVLVTFSLPADGSGSGAAGSEGSKGSVPPMGLDRHYPADPGVGQWRETLRL
jgi:hypothetical protein